MSKRCLGIILLMIPFALSAQRDWTLKSCIEYGLKNNHSNVIYENEKSAADAKAREGLAAYLPTVSGTGTLDNNLKVQTSVIPAGVFGPTDLRVAFTKQYQVNPIAQLDQTIFDQSLITGLQANRYNKVRAELNIVKNEETLIYNISTAYFKIEAYREQIRQLNFSGQTYKGQLEISEQQVRKGIALLKDFEKIKVNLNNTLTQIRIAETNLTLSLNQLKYEMGFPIDEALDIVQTNHETETMLAVDDSVQSSIIQRTDYRLSQVNSQLNEIEERRLRRIIYPKLTAYARYGAIGFGNDLNQAFSSIQSYSAIGLKLSIPIVDFKRNAQVSQAKFKALNANETLKLDEMKYQMEFQNAKVQFQQAQSNLVVYKENIQLAQSTFDAINLQYQKGTTDLTEWLNAQNSLNASQSSYLNSLYTLFQARIDLEKAQGTLKLFYQAL